MKFLLIITLIFFQTTASASVDCMGTPQNVKVGDYGIQESYFIVTIGGVDYHLGSIAHDPAAKSRYATAMAALLSNKPLMLRFYDPYTMCNDASVARAVPNSVQLVQ